MQIFGTRFHVNLGTLQLRVALSIEGSDGEPSDEVAS